MKIKKPRVKHVRKSWGILNPATKVVPDKTKYKRSKGRKNWWAVVDHYTSED
jgi:hypothetical protein